MKGWRILPLLGLSLFAQDAQEIERLSGYYNKEKREVVVWFKTEYIKHHADKAEYDKRYHMAIYGDGLVLRRSGTEYYKGQLDEAGMKKFLKEILELGIMNSQPPDGMPRHNDTWIEESYGIKLREKNVTVKIPHRLDDLIKQRPQDDRLKIVKKVRDKLYQYWGPNNAKCEIDKEELGRK